MLQDLFVVLLPKDSESVFGHGDPGQLVHVREYVDQLPSTVLRRGNHGFRLAYQQVKFVSEHAKDVSISKGTILVTKKHNRTQGV